ncbi:MAG: gamma-glutamyltranspeptidase / glutathione hydrolase [Thermoleophilaceae bacterium]|nr:gamma-glutamyltranspeptidase / glutathione hydrolase [Thermoleophilaceae bacterium]
MKGVVAAGHQLTADAGAQVLREGGNAVDAAVAAVLTSFVAESVLTGPGAGGFMLVHTAGGEDHLLDFFVAAPGLGEPSTGPADLQPVDVHFSDTVVQEFHVGPASCGAYGTTAGLTRALERFGSTGLGSLVDGPVRLAHDGVEISQLQEYLFEILSPLLNTTPEAAALYEPNGRPLKAGEVLRQPELGDLLARLGAEGPAFMYTGDVARAVTDWVGSRGGLLAPEDLAAYAPIDRVPARAAYRGREVLTNPPPSSGGVLIVHALSVLERLGRPDVPSIVEAMDAANKLRTPEFLASLQDPTGSTTHVSVLDADGGCASVTCSNGSSSAVVVPGTGIHMNNMLGEADLNPLGWHRHQPGARIPSMMAPTVVLRDGDPEVVLGSAGSNRIRSAILQTIVGVVDLGLGAQDAVDRDRIHFEDGAVEAEPGVDAEGLNRIEAGRVPVHRWAQRNLFFGGVQAAVRDANSGALSGAGDPRRGGVAVVVE